MAARHFYRLLYDGVTRMRRPATYVARHALQVPTNHALPQPHLVLAFRKDCLH